MARTGNDGGRLSGRARKLIVAATVVALLAVPLSYVLANDTFSDVPSSPASVHDAVNALVAAGITSGCGAGKYCPNNAVTRGQMAIFLDLLGDLSGRKGPVANAALVDGQIVFNGVEDFTLAGGAVTECEVSENGAPPASLAPYTLIHQLYNAPVATSLVNVQISDADQEDGDYQVCFSMVDGTNLTAGTYSTNFMLSAFIGAPFASGAGAKLPARWTGQ